jgi:putative membrane protein
MPARPGVRLATSAATAGLLLGLVVMAGLWLLASGTAGASADGDPDAGRELFAANCAACHGPAGQGSGDAPSLAGVSDRLGPELAARTIREGRNRMPPFGDRFDEGQISDLLAHLEQLPADTGPAERDGSGMPMRHGRWRDMMGEWPASFALLWLSFGVVVLVLLVVGAVWLARWASATTSQHHTAAHPSPARDILDQRYARGEISREEYLQARHDLASPD